MKFTIQVNSSPYHCNAGQTAYRFIMAALAQEHQIFRVFFYHDGIYHAFNYSTPPDDDLQLTTLWSNLAEQYHVDLVVCISAAQRPTQNHRQIARDWTATTIAPCRF